MPNHILLEYSLVLLKLAFSPIVSPVATALSLYKSAFKRITIFECFFRVAMRKVIQPFTFIGVTFIDKFAFPISLVLQDSSKIVRPVPQYKQTFWSLSFHLTKISLEIRFILEDDLSKSFRVSVLPSALVVRLIRHQLIKAILVEGRRCVLVRRFQLLINP